MALCDTNKKTDLGSVYFEEITCIHLSDLNADT